MLRVSRSRLQISCAANLRSLLLLLGLLALNSVIPRVKAEDSEGDTEGEDPACEDGMYLDVDSEECMSCPTGCTKCDSKEVCTECDSSIGMVLDPESALCTCGPKKWLFLDGEAACHSCIDGCATCSNEYKCDTFETCPHKDMELQDDGSCMFKCPNGMTSEDGQCSSCSDENCELCGQGVGQGVEHCYLCKNGFYLDLMSYTCVESCDSEKYLIVETDYTHYKPFATTDSGRRRLQEQGSEGQGDASAEETSSDQTGGSAEETQEGSEAPAETQESSNDQQTSDSEAEQSQTEEQANTEEQTTEEGSSQENTSEETTESTSENTAEDNAEANTEETTEENTEETTEGTSEENTEENAEENSEEMTEETSEEQAEQPDVKVRFCRPWAEKNYNWRDGELKEVKRMEYFIDGKSPEKVELGTIEYPFKNIAAGGKEIFNYIHEKVDTAIRVKRGSDTKMYYGIAPLLALNLDTYSVEAYGDENLAKPHIWITDHEYRWWEGTVFSLEEEDYKKQERVDLGHWDASESSKYFLKVAQLRSHVYFEDVHIQSIMFGDAWLNPFVFTYDTHNDTFVINRSTVDVDGAVGECYTRIAVELLDSNVNITNAEYGLWNDLRYECKTLEDQTLRGYIIIRDSNFFGSWAEALFSWIYLSTWDHFIVTDTKWERTGYMDMDTRPFADVHAAASCDPTSRSQELTFDRNTFKDIEAGNLIFSYNYLKTYETTRKFSMQHNKFIDSQVNKEQFQILDAEGMPIEIAHNIYKNIYIDKQKVLYKVTAEKSDILIHDEHIVDSYMDDLYTISVCKNIEVRDITVEGMKNTGNITDTSALVRIDKASEKTVLKNFVVTDTEFSYGQVVKVEASHELEFSSSQFHDITIANSDLITLNSVAVAKISDLDFQRITKQSDKQRHAISLPTLRLVEGESNFELSDLTFQHSSASFLQVTQVSKEDAADESAYSLMLKDTIVTNNKLSSKDSVISFGEISYKHFTITIQNVNPKENELLLGPLIRFNSNCKVVLQNCETTNNIGQFANLQPASSSDTDNPLLLTIKDNLFKHNFVDGDSLILLTSNSILKAEDSSFIENGSTGRGSILFADYQKVEAELVNCEIKKNYAYQGGVFYVQFASKVRVYNSRIEENFAIIGGVAYVNNDGFVEMSQDTRIVKNAAINTCFLFLINTQDYSILSDVYVSMNDQKNNFVKKEEFLALEGDFMHIKEAYIEAMKGMGEDVEMVVEEKADSAIYAIKAKLRFSDQTQVIDNDKLLSASTESSIELLDITIKDLEATGMVIQTVSSDILLQNVEINNIQTDSGAAETFYKISVMNDSVFRARMTTFSSITDPLIYIGSSEVNFEEDVTLKDLHNPREQSPMIYVSSSTYNVKDTLFQNLKSDKYMALQLVTDSHVKIEDTTVADFDKPFLSLEEGSLKVMRSVIKDGVMSPIEGDPSDPESELFYGYANSMGFIVISCDAIFDDVEMMNLQTQHSAAAIYIENDATSNSEQTLTIKDSKFKYNWAKLSSGVLHALNVNTDISGSHFEGNVAYSQSAGALMLDCSTIARYTCKYSLENLKFKNNIAALNGGAMEYTFYKPHEAGNVYEDNMAQYGQNTASYPTRMVWDDPEVVRESDSQEGNEVHMPPEAGDQLPDDYMPVGAMGDEMEEETEEQMEEGMEEETSQENTENSEAESSGEESNSEGAGQTGGRRLQQATQEKEEATISPLDEDTTKDLALELGLDFNEVIFYDMAEPLIKSGADFTHAITFELLDNDDRVIKTANGNSATISSIDPNVQVVKSTTVTVEDGKFSFDDIVVIGEPGSSIVLKVESNAIDPSKIGKAFPDQVPKTIYIRAQLRLCIAGEYQSSDNKCLQCPDGFYTLQEDQTECSECPDHAQCSAGKDIDVQDGFWKKSRMHTDVFKCYKKSACLGGLDSECDVGYGGNLCHSCIKVEDTWYNKESDQSCQKCVSYKQNIILTIGILILVLFYVVALVWINIKNRGGQRQTAVFMRILTNYFQILTLASSYELNWQDTLKQFLEVVSIISRSSEALLSIDCLLRDNGYTMYPLYVKVILCAILPVFLTAVSIVFWGIVNTLFKVDLKRSLAITIIVLLFVSLPPITSITFTLLNCTDAFSDGHHYLSIDVGVTCWEGEHGRVSLQAAVPTILLWILGTPFLAFLILFRKRTQLQEPENIGTYGFLYIGLKPHTFYWEILLHFRKVALLCANIFLTRFEPLYRALLGFILMILYIELLQKIEPYQREEVNDLELKATFAAFATFYGGLFFVSEGIPVFLSVLLFMLIFGINFYFWISMLKVAFIKQYLWLVKHFTCCDRFFKSKGQKSMFDENSIAEDYAYKNDEQPSQRAGAEDGKSFAIDGQTSFAQRGLMHDQSSIVGHGPAATPETHSKYSHQNPRADKYRDEGNGDLDEPYKEKPKNKGRSKGKVIQESSEEATDPSGKKSSSEEDPKKKKRKISKKVKGSSQSNTGEPGEDSSKKSGEVTRQPQAKGSSESREVDESSEGRTRSKSSKTNSRPGSKKENRRRRSPSEDEEYVPKQKKKSKSRSRRREPSYDEESDSLDEPTKRPMKQSERRRDLSESEQEPVRKKKEKSRSKKRREPSYDDESESEPKRHQVKRREESSEASEEVPQKKKSKKSKASKKHEKSEDHNPARLSYSGTEEEEVPEPKKKAKGAAKVSKGKAEKQEEAKAAESESSEDLEQALARKREKDKAQKKNYRGKHQKEVIESDQNYVDVSSDLPASGRGERKKPGKKGSSTSSHRRSSSGKDGKLNISESSAEE